MQTDFGNIKCIAFDLDDTILNKDKVLSERTAAVLKKALDAGIAVVPVSGRSYATSPECIREFPGLSYAVTSNGAAVYDMRTDERLKSWLLDAKDVRAIMKGVGNFFLEGQITYEAFVDGVAFAAADFVRSPAYFGVPQSAVSYIRQTRKPEQYMIDFIYENASKMDSLSFILKDPGLYRLVENSVKRNAANVYITSSVPYRMEIMSGACGKAVGLRYVLEQLGLAAEQTAAFGDADNDADMLEFAGIGVAVGNATKKCRDSADVVLERTAAEDAVAEYLEQTVLAV